MGLVYGGSMTIGATCPVVDTSIGVAATQLNAQLTGALSLQASLNVTPPTIPATIASLQAFIANLTLAGNLGLPNVSFDLSACATLVASLQVAIGSLLGLPTTLGAAGVFAYVYTGRADGLGPALTTALSGGFPGGSGAAAPTTAVVLGTVTPATATALLSFFSGA